MSDRSAKSAPASGVSGYEYDVVCDDEAEFKDDLNSAVAEGWEVVGYAIHAKPSMPIDGKPITAKELMEGVSTTHSALMRRPLKAPTPKPRKRRITQSTQRK